MNQEFVEVFKNNFYVLLYGLALFVALANYRKYFDSILKYFPIIIGYTFLTETLGNLIRQNENFQIVYLDGLSNSNSIFYNFFDIILFLYFYFIFWKVLKASKHKEIVKYGVVFFVLCTIINPFFQNFILLPQLFALTIGSIILILAIFFYFAEIRRGANSDANKGSLLYWISIGLIIFYPFYPAIVIIGMYYGEFYTNSIELIHYVLIVLMYVTFIYGFLKMKRFKPT